MCRRCPIQRHLAAGLNATWLLLPRMASCLQPDSRGQVTPSPQSSCSTQQGWHPPVDDGVEGVHEGVHALAGWQAVPLHRLAPLHEVHGCRAAQPLASSRVHPPQGQEHAQGRPCSIEALCQPAGAAGAAAGHCKEQEA